MNMDRVIYYNELYDYYQGLLTDKQRLYFEDYYFNNLSLGEIALNNSVSRNAVFNQLKSTLIKLDEYEEKLGLLNKKKGIIKLLEGRVDNNLIEEIKKRI